MEPDDSPQPSGGLDVNSSDPTFSRTPFRSTFRLPHNRATQASADKDIALDHATSGVSDLSTDSGVEGSPAPVEAVEAGNVLSMDSSPRENASPQMADMSFNQAASDFERQSVLLPSPEPLQFSQQQQQQQQQQRRVFASGIATRQTGLRQEVAKQQETTQPATGEEEVEVVKENLGFAIDNESGNGICDKFSTTAEPTNEKLGENQPQELQQKPQELQHQSIETQQRTETVIQQFEEELQKQEIQQQSHELVEQWQESDSQLQPCQESQSQRIEDGEDSIESLFRRIPEFTEDEIDQLLPSSERLSASLDAEETPSEMKPHAANSGSNSRLQQVPPQEQQPQQPPSEKQMQQELRQCEQRIRSLTVENNSLQSELGSCRLVFIEYERCLRLIGERKRQTDAQVAELFRDRDQAVEDLQSVEKAFSDLHKRFEKSKQLVESLRANEAALGKALQEQQARLKRNEQKYLTLKAHAEEKLDAANRHIEEQRRASEAELARLQAVLRKAELQAQNLQAQLDQKSQENAELTSICDELINRVGEDATT